MGETPPTCTVSGTRRGDEGLFARLTKAVKLIFCSLRVPENRSEEENTTSFFAMFSLGEKHKNDVVVFLLGVVSCGERNLIYNKGPVTCHVSACNRQIG